MIENAIPKLRCLCMLLLFFFFSTACQDNKKQKSHKFTNALIEETSPYLLQHAHNPVNWRAWSPEAFEDAKKQNKLVIISVGYSSCHWCHVMEEETFEDIEVAKIMNENFINIKVDREERPDIDQVYMTAVQLMTGNSGWPSNTITLPNGKPIYGGTYHTKTQWSEVLKEINQLFTEDPEKANEYATMVAKGVREVNLVKVPAVLETLSTETLIESVGLWKTLWDQDWGGDRQRQKFIVPVNLNFLTDYGSLAKDDAVLNHVKTTLDKVAMGGIYDQLGGGFYRYSTDPYWKVPHFEKMLYDNAQLIGLYSKAYSVFHEEKYKQTVYETISFLKSEMRNSDGGYYASMDAGGKDEEGSYYLWRQEELQEVLGEEYRLFSLYYNVLPGKEYQEQFVLHKLVEDQKFAEEHGLSLEALQSQKEVWKASLLKIRAQREKPRMDDKIITSWNALLISGMAQAYKSFGDTMFLKEAEWIFASLVKTNYQKDRLVHTYKKGSKQTEGFIEDYAYLIDASLQLYSVTLDISYLTWAQNLTAIAQTDYKDESSGLFRFNNSDALIAKTIKANDGDLPSPNSVMAQNLLILGHLEYNKVFLKEAQQMLTTMLPLLKVNPDSYAGWASLFLKEVYPYYEIAVVGADASSLVKNLHQRFLPNTLIAGSTKESDLPLFKSRFVEEDTYIYVCRDNACKLPVTDIDNALEQLKNF